MNHSVGEYVRGMAHTNGMESFWSVIKRGCNGGFYHLSEDYLHRCVNKFAGRYNVRDMDTIYMMGTVTDNIAGNRLTYKAPITPDRSEGSIH